MHAHSKRKGHKTKVHSYPHEYVARLIQVDYALNDSKSTTQTGLYTYTYDHDRRLTGVRYKRGNDAEFVMLENTYNDLGQLVSTQRHGSSALKTDYEYNVRS